MKDSNVGTKPTLNRYLLFLKRHGSRLILAYGYTEDQSDGCIYFHAKDDLSDRDCFFLKSEIAGIERELSETEIRGGHLSSEEWNALIESLHKMPQSP